MKSINIWTHSFGKRLIAMAVTLVMILGMLPAGLIAPVWATEDAEQTSACICGGNAVDMEGHTCQDITEWTDWGSAKTSLPTASGNYRLTGHIHITAQASIASTNVNLDLNGYTVTIGANPGAQTETGTWNYFRGYAMTGGSLSITDSVGTGKIVAGVRGDGGAVIWLNGAATVNLYGGVLDGSNTTQTTSDTFNGAIRLSNADAVLNIYGGTVIGADDVTQYEAGADGAAVGAANVTGGAIYANTGTVNICGGEIYGGMNSDSCSNIYLSGSAVADISGGTVYGGVYYSASNALTVSGSVRILDSYNGDAVDALMLASAKTVTVGSLNADADIRIEANTINSTIAYFTDEAAQSIYAYQISIAQNSLSGDLVVVPGTVSNLKIAEGKCGCVCGGKAEGINGHTCQKVIWSALTPADGVITLPSASGYYYLTGDAQAKQAAISSANTVSLDLNGHSLTMAANTSSTAGNYYRAYVLQGEGAVLNITDSVGDGVIYAGVQQDGGSLIRLMKECTVNLYGGILDGSTMTTTTSTSAINGIVELQAGTFNMYGGRLIGLTELAASKVNGAAVGVSNAEFNLYGGQIVGGTAGSGGGVYVTAGSFKMYGGTVTGGGCTNGGSLYVSTSGIIEIHGGTVRDGQATYGGNVHVNGASTFIMDGGEVYGGSATYGANIFVGGNAGGSASITGGTVYGGVRTTGATLSIGGSAKLLDATKEGEAISSLECAGTVTFTALNSDADIKVEGEVGALNAQFADGAADTFTDQLTVGQNSKAGRELYINSSLQIVEGKFGCVCGGHAEGMEGHSCQIVEWKPLTPDEDGKVTLPTTGNYYLTADAALGQQGVLTKENLNVSFDLNGHTVTMAPNTGAQTETGTWNYQGGFILNSSSAGSVLNITDSVGGGRLVTGVRYPSGAAIRLQSAATVNLYGGILDGSSMTQSTTQIAEGIVKLENGTFNMYGGQIIGVGEVQRYATGSGDTLAEDTSVTVNGGAVTVSNGEFNLYGGTISGTTQQTNGGNIYVTGTSAVFNMYGGVIEDGDALLGGNVSAINSGIFNLYGGAIQNGSSGSGGNVYIKNNGVFNAYSGKILSGEADNYGGNIYVDSTGTLQLLAKEDLAAPVIADGQAREGGNIDLKNGGVCLMTTGIVSGGVAAADNYGGNIYVNAGSSFSMSDGEIYGGSAGTGANIFIGGNAGGSVSITGGTVYGGVKTTGTTLSVGGSARILDVTKEGEAISALECGNTVTILVLTANADIKVEGQAGPLKAVYADGAEDSFSYQITVGQLSKGDTGLMVTKSLQIAEARLSCACGGLAEGMEGHSCEIIEWLPWEDSTKIPSSGSYYLTVDIEDAKQVGISQLDLDLNGHSIRVGANPASARGNSYRVFALEDDTDRLNITDTSADQTGVIYAGERHDCGHIVYILNCSAIFNLYGGTLSGEESETTNGNLGNLGGIVYSSLDGTFNMYGGKIRGLSGITFAEPEKLISNNIAGVIVTGAAVTISGTFNMYGGVIENGNAILEETFAAGDGGNVYILPDSTFNMCGGQITGGTAQYGGNVFIGAGSVFNQTGGTVSGGTASEAGEDVYYAEQGICYTVTIQNYDGTVLSQQILYRGEAPVVDDLVAEREEDTTYTYSHIGWTPNVNYAIADATYVATFEATMKDIVYWNLSLGDDLSMNFFVEVEQEQVEQAYVKIAVAGGEPVSYKVADASVEDGYYKFSVCVAAAQMTDTFTLQLVIGDAEGAVHEYSVLQYAQTVLADETMSDYHSLIKEMLCYGAEAQTYFGYNLDNIIDPTLYEGAGATQIDENDAPATGVKGKVSGISCYGATLLARTNLAVRVYFSGDLSAHTVMAGDTKLTPAQKNGMWYVQISDITPQNLDEVITVTVDDAFTFTYSPMNYIVNMNQKGDESLKALLTAMYNYHLAAEAIAEDK